MRGDTLLNELKALRAEMRELKALLSERLRRNNGARCYEIDGLPLREYLAKNNIDVSVNMVHNRLYRGWTLKEAITIPKGDPRFERRKRKIEYSNFKRGIILKGGKSAHIASEGKGHITKWASFVNGGKNE